MASVASSAPEILIEHIARRPRRASVSGRAASCCPTTRRCGSPRRSTRSKRSASRAASTWESGGRPAPIRPPRARCAPSTPSSFPAAAARDARRCRGARFPPDHPFRVRAGRSGRRDAAADLGARPRAARARGFAGSLGLGYSVRATFQPDVRREPAIQCLSRRASRPSAAVSRSPHVILGVSVICAPTDEEADYLARHHRPGLGALPEGRVRPVTDPRRGRGLQLERLRALRRARRTVTPLHRHPSRGDCPDRSAGASTSATEVIVTTMIHDHQERVRSYELLAGAAGM